MSDHTDYLKEEPIHNAEQKVDSQTPLSSCSVNTIPQNDDRVITILIAEDIESNYMLLKAVLENDYRILHAQNGLEAIEIFQKHQPDLILMDIKMPELDGWEATRCIRKYSTTIPIIAQTAFAYKTDKLKASGAGFNDFLTKPISISLLRQTIKKYV